MQRGGEARPLFDMGRIQDRLLRLEGIAAGNRNQLKEANDAMLLALNRLWSVEKALWREQEKTTRMLALLTAWKRGKPLQTSYPTGGRARDFRSA